MKLILLNRARKSKARPIIFWLTNGNFFDYCNAPNLRIAKRSDFWRKLTAFLQTEIVSGGVTKCAANLIWRAIRGNRRDRAEVEIRDVFMADA